MTLATNVVSYLLDNKQPDRVALLGPEGQRTYGELLDGVLRLSAALRRMGLRKGDRVLAVGENSFFWVTCYLGALHAGAVWVPLATDSSPEHLQGISRRTQPVLCFVQSRLLMRNQAAFAGLHVVTDLAAPAVPGLASQQSLDQMLSECQAIEPPQSEVVPDDLAALVFTSGSTGQPRGVMVSHANIMANTESIIASLSLTELDRMMAVLPLHYCFGASLLHTHLRAGGSIVLGPRFLYPEAVLNELQSKECTGFAGVPSHFQILLRNTTIRQRSFPRLRHVQQAGGPLAPAFIRELRTALPGTQVFIMYGQTEATARLSCLSPEFLDSKLGSIGKGLPGVELSVLDEHGEKVAPGEVGEIVATGGNVARGYWCAPEETSQWFRDGRLYTGDLATVDEDGFIFIVDRIKDFVKSGGIRVSCRQVEHELLACEDLLEAAIIGMPDDLLGEALKAFVVPRASTAGGVKERVAAFCNESLAPALRPKEIVVLSSLPKSDSGKVLKSALKAL
ncbi:MAG TPA: class I adenylate-forming enzyme family protein [Bryobacteraceae bacterium]|nr:class I adenylate-forming enzyme family protein [Bryobacteraceae bacterium]